MGGMKRRRRDTTLSMKRRIADLEGHAPAMVADTEENKRLRIERAITGMILDGVARLKANGERGALLEKAVRGVVEDQYEDLNQEARQIIADGWIETIRGWTRLDWMMKAGMEGPPSA